MTLKYLINSNSDNTSVMHIFTEKEKAEAQKAEEYLVMISEVLNTVYQGQHSVSGPAMKTEPKHHDLPSIAVMITHMPSLNMYCIAWLYNKVNLITTI